MVNYCAIFCNKQTILIKLANLLNMLEITPKEFVYLNLPLPYPTIRVYLVNYGNYKPIVTYQINTKKYSEENTRHLYLKLYFCRTY